MKATRLKISAILAVTLAVLGGSAFAQMPALNSPNVPQKAPPVKKFEGICYPPDSPFYARIPQGFIPFVGMIDCIKSGGTPAKR